MVKLSDLSVMDAEIFARNYEETYMPPDVTMKILRDSIPAHLFERSLPLSMFFLLFNLLLCAVTCYAATWIDTVPHPWHIFLWPFNWWFQGIFGMGLWTMGHECGHNAFSDYTWLNHGIGMVLHTGLLVPYHSWRFSHAQHHSQTGNIAGDQVFVPKPRSVIRPHEPSAWREALESSSPFVAARVLSYLLMGWPAYVTINLSGNRDKYPGFTTHFLPSSPLFEPKHRVSVIWSNVGLLVALSLIASSIYLTSCWTVIKLYGAPYVLVTGWMVCITYLQHTDVFVPHYRPKQWNFVRGALCTVDRDWGWFLNWAFHHVHAVHVAHHIFPRMPHYNAVRARPYLAEVLGDHYLHDSTPIWTALCRVGRNCLFVEDTGDVVFYKRK